MTQPYLKVQLGMVASEAEVRFETRLIENQCRVFQIAYSILGNHAEAEEVAQETFLRAYQTFRSLRDGEKFRGWVNRIAFRLALNRQRAARRRLARDTAWRVGVPETVDGAQATEDRLTLEQLRHAIEMLPDKFRRVLQLSVVEELNATEVGAVLGVPPGTVRSRLHAARKLLLEAMK